MYIEKNKIFIGPDDGVSLPVPDMVHKVAPERFGGALMIIEWGLPPGGMIPLHTHTREDECNFDEYEEIVSSAMDEDQHRRARAELGERYGVIWHDECIPEARARFGIGP